jgi:hypothetical protein
MLGVEAQAARHTMTQQFWPTHDTIKGIAVERRVKMNALRVKIAGIQKNCSFLFAKVTKNDAGTVDRRISFFVIVVKGYLIGTCLSPPLRGFPYLFDS